MQRAICSVAVSEIRLSPEHIRREATAMIDGRESISIFWEIEGPAQAIPTPLQRMDFAAIAFICFAMRGDMDLHIEGPVSASLLENLEQFSRIWTNWLPDSRKPVRVSADQEIEDPAQTPTRQSSGVVAFSGGVDACYSAYSHVKGKHPRASRNLMAGVVVHGMDIPLADVEAFRIVTESAREMLADLNIPTVTVKTNWRSATSADWGMEFAAGLLSSLHQWAEDVSSMVVGSCEDYSRLVIPWGSHPLPTRLLSAATIRNLYDGGELTRTEKVEAISDWQFGYNRLRVCWQEGAEGGNCGVCEKCLRTKLNAIACDLPLPKSLGRMPTNREVRNILPYNSGQEILLREIIDIANVRGVDHPLIRSAQIALRLMKPRWIARNIYGKFRRLLSMGAQNI